MIIVNVSDSFFQRESELVGQVTNTDLAYLTHDATSVRKNHLTGKNHVKFVCDYYEGMWTV